MRFLLVAFYFLSIFSFAQEKGDMEYVFENIQEADEKPELVYHLDLSKSRLKVFPKNLQRFVNLKSLNLSKNKISLLPAEIGSLHELEILNLSRNKIYSIPPQIGELKQLKEFNIARNEVENVPAEFGELSALESANFFENKLEEINPNIQKLKNLKELDLRGFLVSEELKTAMEKWLPHTKIHFSTGCDCGF